MPKIDSYPRITSPQNDDLLLISDQSEDFDSKSISLSQVSGVVNSGKQNQITLTTLGTDGPATFVGDVLNIPNYTPSGGGGSGTITDIATTAPITGGPINSIGTIGITQSSLTTDGYLSAADFTTFNNKQSTSEKGAASGYAPLDANQKVPSANLPDSIVGAVSYQGTWDAQNNNPALPNPTTVQGHYYVTKVPGTYLSNVYAIGDWVISNGTIWEKVDNTQNVNSVFGRTGNVVADAGDYSTFYLGINDGYTNADVDAHLNNDGSVADNALLSWNGTDYAWVSQGTQGFVTSVNNQTGTVTLDTDDIAEGSSNLYFPGFGTAAGTALEGNTAVGQVQSITTNGTAGAATLIAGVLNIPQYTESSSVTFDYTDSGTNLLIGESVTYTTQQGNVGLGEGALSNQTVSNYNTAVGYQSLQYSISGAGQNTALGYRALQGVNSVSTGFYNTATGYEAGMRIESAQLNTFVGYQAGDQVTDGNTNVIIGSLAGGAITVHDDNVIIGSSAASALTGNKNVVIGKDAYTTASSTGDNNIVIGFNAEPSSNTVDNEITIGDANVNSLRLPGVQVGASDGDVLTYSSSSGNITLQPSGGAESLNDLTDASTVKGGFNGGNNTENLILGQVASNLPNLDTTSSFGGNIILQPSTIGNPTNLSSGYRNVLITERSGTALTTGSENIAIGTGALNDSVTGNQSVAIGVNALALNTKTGTTHNTAVGTGAAVNSSTGQKITSVGAQSGFSSYPGTGSNITTIGYQAWASSSSANNEITLGNSSVTALRCAVTSITSLSDERDKKDITDLEYGLDFIESLQPKQFVWDNRTEIAVTKDEEGNDVTEEIHSANKGKKDFGFIAQEVQALDNDVLRLVYDENPDKLEMSYGKLVPILVKAVKELSDKVKALEGK